MTPLANEADIMARLGRVLTASEAARVDAVLTDASSAVRNRARQTFTEASETVRLPVRRGVVRLPQRPVTAVATVVNVNGDPVLYTWDADRLRTSVNVPDSFAWEPFRTGIEVVDVTYTHGFDPIPDDLIGVVCSIVIRALGRRPEDAGLTSETIAGYSYSIGAAGAAGGFGMLPDELAIIDAYRDTSGVIWTGV